MITFKQSLSLGILLFCSLAWAKQSVAHGALCWALRETNDMLARQNETTYDIVFFDKNLKEINSVAIYGKINTSHFLRDTALHAQYNKFLDPTIKNIHTPYPCFVNAFEFGCKGKVAGLTFCNLINHNLKLLPKGIERAPQYNQSNGTLSGFMPKYINNVQTIPFIFKKYNNSSLSVIEQKNSYATQFTSLDLLPQAIQIDYMVTGSKDIGKTFTLYFTNEVLTLLNSKALNTIEHSKQLPKHLSIWTKSKYFFINKLKN